MLKEWKDIPGCLIGDVATFKCLEVIFSNILTIFVSLAVLALFVMLIIGGFKYLTSAGDPKAAGSARQTMTYAIAGIVLMALAYLIFKLIETFTGVTITVFTVPTGTP